MHIVRVYVQSHRRAAQLQTMWVKWAVLHLLEPSKLCQKLLFSLTLITQPVSTNKLKPFFFCELAKLRHKRIRFSHFCTWHIKLGWAKCQLMVQNVIKYTLCSFCVSISPHYCVSTSSLPFSCRHFSPTSLLAQSPETQPLSLPHCHLPHSCLLHHCPAITVNVTIVNMLPPYCYLLLSPSLAPGALAVDCSGILLWKWVVN